MFIKKINIYLCKNYKHNLFIYNINFIIIFK